MSEGALAVHSWLGALALFLTGSVAGAVNVLAGGGSFLTLPVLIFLGLPATVANGTNRVAILAQNAGAVWGFGRHRLVDGGWVTRAALPALLGAVLGTWLALEIGDRAFRRILAILMVVVAVGTIWSPAWLRSAAERPETALTSRPGLLFGFFLVGVYGGFVQAGVGFLLLAMATLAGLDLVRGNALKVLVVLCFTPVALGLFAAGGKVAWGMGLALAAGNLTGGLVGVRLTVLKGHTWVRRFVTGAVLVFAVGLWLTG